MKKLFIGLLGLLVLPLAAQTTPIKNAAISGNSTISGNLVLLGLPLDLSNTTANNVLTLNSSGNLVLAPGGGGGGSASNLATDTGFTVSGNGTSTLSFNGSLNLANISTSGASSGYVLTYNGSGLAWAAATGGIPSITGTVNQIVESGSPGATTLSLNSTLILPGTEKLGGNLDLASYTVINGTLAANVSGTNMTVSGNDTAQLVTADSLINYTPPITSNAGYYVIFGSVPLTALKSVNGSANIDLSEYGSFGAISTNAQHYLGMNTTNNTDVLMIQKNTPTTSIPVGQSGIDFLSDSDTNGTTVSANAVYGAIGFDSTNTGFASNGRIYLSFSPPFIAPNYTQPVSGVGQAELQQEGVWNGNYVAIPAIEFNSDWSLDRKDPLGHVEWSLKSPNFGPGTLEMQLIGTAAFFNGSHADALYTALNDSGDNIGLGVNRSNLNYHGYINRGGYLQSYAPGGLMLLTGNASANMTFVTGGDNLANYRMVIFNSGNVAIGANTTLGSDPGVLLQVSGTTVVNGSLTASNYIGTNTTGNATTGGIGEYVYANGSVSSGGNHTVTSVANITITPGDWDVSAQIDFSMTSFTGTDLVAGIATGNSSLGVSDTHTYYPGFTSVSDDYQVAMPTTRFSVSTNTTLYLNAEATYTVGSLTFSGFLSARRAR